MTGTLADLRPAWLSAMTDHYGPPACGRFPERGAVLRETWRWRVGDDRAELLVAVNHDGEGARVLVSTGGARPITLLAELPAAPKGAQIRRLLEAVGLLPSTGTGTDEP